ncbi:MAG TPA: orotidine-5'-phosphate decarboxylase [bacterium]|nr:orotidine-5'-phosphate decarboxylase [bacterium]
MPAEAAHAGEQPVIVALDAMPEAEAVLLARALSGRVWGSKVNDLLLQAGVDVIARLHAYGHVFCDVKLFDIPNTVANQVTRLAEAGAELITLHCAGGAAMLAAARNARDRVNPATRLLGVTVLTSFDDAAAEATFGRAVEPQVRAFTGLALEAGLDGIVCSPAELPLLAEADPERHLLRVTPGVRPAWHGVADDQRRTLAPAEAMAQGADLLVIGRPITQADDPVAACERILAELG